MGFNESEPSQHTDERRTEAKYLDMNGNTVEPQQACKKVVSFFDGQGKVVCVKLEFSKNGFFDNEEVDGIVPQRIGGS